MTCPPHHYVYEPPHGPTSLGVCRRCGDEVQHYNAILFDRAPHDLKARKRADSRLWPQRRRKHGPG